MVSFYVLGSVSMDVHGKGGCCELPARVVNEPAVPIQQTVKVGSGQTAVSATPVGGTVGGTIGKVH